ncbi:hypothetical protein UFOVP218_30 [uncultured Caudovirales phage]|uniref:Major tail protein n=1 Tax=uncultured Caudovirales phage TaxID=2100421 RepID=A0A6J7WTH2_9CAUD|nr:hypothetical protein UFOVP218_30 [uncultured Caudovirales phage]
MATAVNLIRNSRIFFTTNVDSYGRIKIGAYKDGTSPMNSGLVSGTANCWELQVLEGLTFSQNTTQDTITLNEAGATPSRGQRSFNTALQPLDFSFSTYIRPYKNGSTDPVTAEERVLWNAFAGNATLASGTNWTETGTSTTDTGVTYTNGTAKLNFLNSNKHQLLPFGLIILFDNAAYCLDNCALDTATVDFGIDAIGTIAWAGKGSSIRPLTDIAASAYVDSVTSITFSGTDASGTTPDPADTAYPKNVNGRYITNKLSTMILNDGIADYTNSSTTFPSYSVALTGGQIVFNNNLTYLTPANLATVNLPITYFTGTRAITGNVTAYLKTGTTSETAALLKDMLAAAPSTPDPKYTINIQMGGPTSNSTGVEFKLPSAMLQIPQINTAQVISTTINFTAQGNDGAGNYAITAQNEATIVYRSAPASA